jgi:hypothetical protein
MMGDLQRVDNNPSEDRGMTPRVFEYLFARIREVILIYIDGYLLYYLPFYFINPDQGLFS